MKSLLKLPIAEKWIVNASPIIALSRVGQIELITQLPEKVFVPQAVKEELLQKALCKKFFYQTHWHIINCHSSKTAWFN